MMATPTATPTVDSAVENTVQPTAHERLTDMIQTLQSWAVEIKDMISVAKAAQKENAKMQKSLSSKRKSRGASATDNADGEPSNTRRRTTPSGFTKPVLLSDALCAFVGMPSGSVLPRTEVTKKITEYIKEQGLQDQADKRHILPDAKLNTILDLGDNPDVRLTYFNLQTFIKHNFTKVASEASA
jgi:chromatin remodeling complex protein RSC6